MKLTELREKLRTHLVEIFEDIREGEKPSPEDIAIVQKVKDAPTIGDLMEIMAEMACDVPSAIGAIVHAVCADGSPEAEGVDLWEEVGNTPMHWDT